MQAGKQIGQFTIEKVLGQGAMGAVYLAQHPALGRVAVKFMHAGMSESETAHARFVREVDVLKQVKHPNIVRVLGSGRYKGSPFYVMEHIEGQSLDKSLSRRGRYSWEEVLDIGKQLCDALQRVHDEGVIHRDLKPSNLMVTNDGTLKLTDFGIAKDLDEATLTSTHCTVGTAAYMSPEQCRGERNLTHKSDLYSLGVVFYELLTGEKPFRADTTMDMFLQHVQGTFERPSRKVMDIPVWLDTVVCQLLEKKPERRPFDAVTVRHTLEQVREKVSAQKSAGVDAVKARGTKGADDTDKETARTLLEATGKKRKRKRKPFWESVFFQIPAILAVLTAFSSIMYYVFFAKPGADTLFKEAAAVMVEEDSVKWGNAVKEDGPIGEFLARFPGDPRADQVRKMRDRVEVFQVGTKITRKMKLARNLGRPYDYESVPERQAAEALHLTDFGDYYFARERWRHIRQQYDKGDEHRVWRALAEAKLEELSKQAIPDGVEKGLAARKELLEKKLKEALDHMAGGKDTEARAVCEDILALYKDPDPLLEPYTRQARGLLQIRRAEKAPDKTKS